jgi:hypothetical protein
LKRFLIGAALIVSLIPTPTTATTDTGVCRALAREGGYKYAHAIEMNAMGCVHSSSKGYYVPRSGSCNLRARNQTQAYPYPRDFEVARRIAKYCVADSNYLYTSR